MNKCSKLIKIVATHIGRKEPNKRPRDQDEDGSPNVSIEARKPGTLGSASFTVGESQSKNKKKHGFQVKNACMADTNPQKQSIEDLEKQDIYEMQGAFQNLTKTQDDCIRSPEVS